MRLYPAFKTISILATDHLHISFLGCPHGCVEGPHILGVERDHTYWEWRGTTHTGSGEGPHILGMEWDHTYWEWRGTTHTGSGEGPHILGVERGPHILGMERDHTYWEWRGDHTILGVERDHTYWEWRGTTHTGSGEGPHILGVERDHTYWEWSGTTHTGSGEGLCYYPHECVFMHYDKGYHRREQLSLRKLSLAIVPFFVLRHITTK